MSDIILIKGKILIDTADIQDLRGCEYQGKPDEDLSGKFIVRVFLRSVSGQGSSPCPSTPTAVSKTPFIDLVCDSLPEAQQLYKNILKSRHVVDINEMRYGK